jgi:hypothetical protein
MPSYISRPPKATQRIMIEESCYMWQDQAVYMMNAFSYFFARENFSLSCIVDLPEVLQVEYGYTIVAITFATALFIPAKNSYRSYL